MLILRSIILRTPAYIGLIISLAMVAVSCQGPTNSQPLKLNSLFTHHMVLQQQTEAAFWGSYTPHQSITISASWGAETRAKTDETGQWRAMLNTPTAGGPFDITISGQDTTVVINDVLIGEVWVASGQSNMEMPLTGYLPNEPIDNYQQEIAAADYSQIRMFTVGRNASGIELDSLKGDWQVCSPSTASEFSASAYFFARKIHQELKVPVGILHTSWGGTEAEAWTSKSGLANFPDFIREIAAYNPDEVTDWVDQFTLLTRPNSLAELESFDAQDKMVSSADYDDSDWIKLELPHNSCKADVFIPGTGTDGNLNGMFWYRTSFDMIDTVGSYKLVMGAIDDADVTYLNGHKIGSTLGWQTPRVYEIPPSILKMGSNTIAIKHYDGGGGSAVQGPIYLEKNDGQRIDLAGSWSGMFYADLKGEDMIIYGSEHQQELVSRPASVHTGPNQLASSLYNGMLHPLIPFTIKGAIWYQGESNVGRASQYERLFPDMITDWRAQWGYEFPFYFVQIAPFSYGNELSAALRDAQRKSLNTAATGMAITMDIGDSLSIHPGNKQDVGHRLALLALANDYGQDLVKSGPLYKEHQVDDSYLDISFDFIGSGLLASGDLIGFEVAGEDGIYFQAQASIVDNKIRLNAPEVPNPVHARYGWSDYLVPSLFNQEGLPASSFKTEQ